MGHQKLHLIAQDAPVAQNKIFPQRRHIRRVEQGHSRLFWGARAFAVIARAASGHHVHPCVGPLLGKRNDVLTGEFKLGEQAPAVGAHISVAGKELAVGESWPQCKGVDIGHTTRANDAVDLNDRLLPRDGVVAAAKNCDSRARLPPHLLGRIMDHRLF